MLQNALNFVTFFFKSFSTSEHNASTETPRSAHHTSDGTSERTLSISQLKRENHARVMVLAQRPRVQQVNHDFYSHKVFIKIFNFFNFNREQFPCVTLQVLNEHCDEVWFCKFSNDGTKLATGSKDNTLIIWDVNPATHKVTFNKSYDDHLNGVAWVTWSPDDRYLLVCGNDECTELWIWDIEQKVLKKRLNHNHDDSLTSAAWLPCGQYFVTAGTKGQFYYCVSAFFSSLSRDDARILSFFSLLGLRRKYSRNVGGCQS